jgi:hypothetical protein
MHLLELQNAFQHYLTDDVKGVSIFASVAPLASGDVADRLNIYHHAYRARIREALASQFPNLKKLLGSEQFAHHVDGFITEHPSTFRNMRWLGDKFSDYLDKAAPKKPIYADMADFEWHLGLAFDAADTPIITLQHLSEISPDLWGGLRFQWHPSVYLKNAQVNVIEAWKAMETGTHFTLSAEPLTYLIWRKDLVSQFKSTTAIEASAIAFMQQNHTFGELCEFLSAQLAEDKAIEMAAGLLADWLQQEMLVELSLE